MVRPLAPEKMQYRSGLLDDFITETGLIFNPP